MSAYRPPDGWEKVVIEAWEDGATIKQACRKAGVSMSTFIHYRKTDPNVQFLWEQAQAVRLQMLEDEADRRAVGWREPIYDRDGKRIGSRLLGSDQMMKCRLRKLDPDGYSEQVQPQQQAVLPVLIELPMQRKDDGDDR